MGYSFKPITSPEQRQVLCEFLSGLSLFSSVHKRPSSDMPGTSLQSVVELKTQKVSQLQPNTLLISLLYFLSSCENRSPTTQAGLPLSASNFFSQISRHAVKNGRIAQQFHDLLRCPGDSHIPSCVCSYLCNGDREPCQLWKPCSLSLLA